MKIGISEQIALCCNLAEQAIENDGWAVDYIYNEDGDESYSEGTQDRFSQYYGVFWEQLNNAKVKDYALALVAMVAGVTMGYVIFGLIIYMIWRI